MINGCWLSCHSPCPRTGRTFAADAIISNPPTFAHVHCAEALGIPLLMSFSKFLSFILYSLFSDEGDRIAMPWSVITKAIHCTTLTEKSNAGLQQLLSRILWSTSPPQMRATVLVTTSAMLPRSSSLGRGKKDFSRLNVGQFV